MFLLSSKVRRGRQKVRLPSPKGFHLFLIIGRRSFEKITDLSIRGFSVDGNRGFEFGHDGVDAEDHLFI